jgi:hypothetical protein
MKFAFRKLPLMALGLAVMAVAQPASAGIIVQTDTYAMQATPFSDALTFNSFNASLGTLTGVTIQLNETGTVTTFVANFGTAANYSNVIGTGTVSVTGPNATMVTTSFSSSPYAGNIGAGTFFSPTTIVLGTTSGSASTTSSVASSSFSFFESPPSTLTYVINAVGSTSASGTSTMGSGPVLYGANATVGGSVVITYTFTAAVPEPASLGMVVLGLGGICAVRRFRRKVA